MYRSLCGHNFSFLWTNPMYSASYMASLRLVFFSSYQSAFHSGWVTLHSHQLCMREPASPWQRLPLSLVYFICSSKCAVMSHSPPYFHLPHGQWWQTSFHVLICYLNIFFEMSLHVFCSFFNSVACIFTVKFSGFFVYTRYESFVRYVVCK